MTEQHEIRQRLRQFVYEQFPPAKARQLADDDPLLGSNTVDSLGLLSLVSFMESEFGFTLDDEEFVPEHFLSLAKLTAFVAAKMKPKQVEESQHEHHE